MFALARICTCTQNARFDPMREGFEWEAEIKVDVLWDKTCGEVSYGE